MASVEFATILALGAALLAGIGYVTLQRSARQVTAEEYVGHFTLFHLSLRHALWWLGSLAAVASFTLQAIALTMGSVVLVQSLQATALLFALLIDARLTHHRCTPREWMWAVLLAGAVAVIVMSATRRPALLGPPSRPGRWLLSWLFRRWCFVWLVHGLPRVRCPRCCWRWRRRQRWRYSPC